MEIGTIDGAPQIIDFDLELTNYNRTTRMLSATAICNEIIDDNVLVRVK